MLKADPKARETLIATKATLVPDRVNGQIVRAANRARDLVTCDGWTVEVTPPDAPDACGGWWVLVDDTGKPDRARATPTELA